MSERKARELATWADERALEVGYKIRPRRKGRKAYRGKPGAVARHMHMPERWS